MMCLKDDAAAYDAVGRRRRRRKKAMNIVITLPVLPLIIHGNLLRIKNVFCNER